MCGCRSSGGTSRSPGATPRRRYGEKLLQNSSDISSPTAPAIIRMIPSVLMSDPSVVTVTAKVRIAPTTSRKMLAPMLMSFPSTRMSRSRSSYPSGSEGKQPGSARAVAGPQLGVVDRQPHRAGHLELVDETGEQARGGERQQLPAVAVEQLEHQPGQGRQQADHQRLAGPAHGQAAEADGPGPFGPGPALPRVGVVQRPLADHQQPRRPQRPRRPQQDQIG